MRRVAVLGIVAVLVVAAGCTSPAIRDSFEVQGHQLSVVCGGSGSPTIVLIHGLFVPQGTFDEVRADLETDHRVCSYDRVNVGASSTDPDRHSITDSADELDGVISAVGIETPVVLVGHSFGGEIALMYAGFHPQNVSGMVLIDAELPLHEDLNQRFFSPERLAESAAFVDGNPERVHYSAAAAEARAVLGSLPEVPISYLRATQRSYPPKWPEGAYEAALAEFMSSLPGGRVVEVASGHIIQEERPQSVIDEVRVVLDRLPTPTSVS
jgi:pimeloyl-ACP methyl ester carboxylesterase